MVKKGWWKQTQVTESRESFHHLYSAPPPSCQTSWRRSILATTTRKILFRTRRYIWRKHTLNCILDHIVQKHMAEREITLLCDGCKGPMKRHLIKFRVNNTKVKVFRKSIDATIVSQETNYCFINYLFTIIDRVIGWQKRLERKTLHGWWQIIGLIQNWGKANNAEAPTSTRLDEQHIVLTSFWKTKEKNQILARYWNRERE